MSTEEIIWTHTAHTVTDTDVTDEEVIDKHMICHKEAVLEINVVFREFLSPFLTASYVCSVCSVCGVCGVGGGGEGNGWSSFLLVRHTILLSSTDCF